MTVQLQITGYDLSDEGPGRTVNEDATLIRMDLGLFAVADGAGGRGKGNVAASLALRSIENFVGATVRRTHERPDYDLLGIPEQAKRLSAAVHQAQANVLDVVRGAPDRTGMASTVVAVLFAPRTHELHIAHVGDSRLYRLRHGRLEQLTEDHTIATDVLERRPDVTDDVLANLPRNSVVRALGLEADFRVAMRSVPVIAGDRFLLCTDGLSSAVSYDRIWQVMREPDPPGVIASELLSHALANHSQDNITVMMLDVAEMLIEEDVPTRRYNEHPKPPPSSPLIESSNGPNSANLFGPEVVSEDVVGEWALEPEEPPDSWETELDEAATQVRGHAVQDRDSDQTHTFDAELVQLAAARALDANENAPTTQSSEGVERTTSVPPSSFNVSEIDLEIENEDELRALFDGGEEVSEVVVDDQGTVRRS